MAVQSLLARDGLRTGILGDPGALAIAAPIADGDLSNTASSAGNRIGVYFNRALTEERIGFVVMGTETVQFRQAATNVLTVLNVSEEVNTPASTTARPSLVMPHGVAPSSPIDGAAWTTTAGLFVRINGVTVGPMSAGGGGAIGGSIANGQIAVGNGVNTIAGSASFTWTSLNGLNSNRSAVSTNQMFGQGSGNSTMSGGDNTFVGHSAGPAITTGNNNVIIGKFAANVMTTGFSNVIIGSAAGSTSNADELTFIGNGAGLNNSGAGNVAVGASAMAGAVGSTGAGNVAVGASALASISTDAQNIAIGPSALGNLVGSTGRNVAIGYQAGLSQITGNNSIFIGRSAGESAPNNLTNVFVAGSITSPINEVYFGTGHTYSAASTYAIRGTNGTGSNNAGGGINVAGGRSTGTGIGGAVSIYTTPAGVSGTSTNTELLRVAILSDGRAEWTGIATASSPSVSAASKGAIFYDSTLQKFRVSQNGGAYQDLVASSGIGGSISTDQVAVGSGANTIAGSNNFTWSTTNGLNSNRVAATGNQMFGFNAGNTTLTGTNNTLVGNGPGVALTTGNNNLLAGFDAAKAITTGANNVILGSTAGQALGTDSANNVFVGSGAGTTLAGVSSANVFIGRGSGNGTTSATGSIIIGNFAAENHPATLNGVCIIGSPSNAITDVYLGGAGGFRTVITAHCTVHGTSAVGSNLPGSNMTYAAGRGTGTGVGGALYFQTAKAGTSGSSLNTLVTRLGVLQDGRTEWTGITTANEPAVSGANSGAIFYDSTLQKFRYSANGSAYADLVGGGGIGGSISSGQVAVGSGVNTIAGSTNLTWSTANGLSSNRSSFSGNEMFGITAGNTTMSGQNNTLVGSSAGVAITSGQRNTFLGRQSGLVMTTAVDSVCLGYQAGGNVNVNQVVYVGEQAGYNNSGAGNVAVGSNALFAAPGSTGTGNVAIGISTLQSISTDIQNVAVGNSALSNLVGSTGRNVAIGYQAGINQTTANNNILLGHTAGDNAPVSVANTFIAGSNTSPINDVYFGKGHTNGIATAYAIRGTNGTGPNNAGGGINIAGGRSTGTGVGGAVSIYTTPTGLSGSSANSEILRVAILSDGRTEWTGIATASAPAISAANKGAIFYDSTLQKFRVSQNGSAYQDLVAGGTLPGVNWLWSTTSSFGFSNTTSETNLLTGGTGSLTVPANTMGAGTEIEIVICGTMAATGASPTLQYKVNFGGVAIATFGAQTLPSIAATTSYRLVVTLQTESAGAAATIYTTMALSIGASLSYGTSLTRVEGATFLTDTTIANLINVTAQFNTADIGNAINVNKAIMRVTHPFA